MGCRRVVVLPFSNPCLRDCPSRWYRCRCRCCYDDDSYCSTCKSYRAFCYALRRSIASVASTLFSSTANASSDGDAEWASSVWVSLLVIVSCPLALFIIYLAWKWFYLLLRLLPMSPYYLCILFASLLSLSLLFLLVKFTLTTRLVTEAPVTSLVLLHPNSLAASSEINRIVPRRFTTSIACGYIFVYACSTLQMFSISLCTETSVMEHAYSGSRVHCATSRTQTYTGSGLPLKWIAINRCTPVLIRNDCYALTPCVLFSSPAWLSRSAGRKVLISLPAMLFAGTPKSYSADGLAEIMFPSLLNETSAVGQFCVINSLISLICLIWYAEVTSRM